MNGNTFPNFRSPDGQQHLGKIALSPLSELAIQCQLPTLPPQSTFEDRGQSIPHGQFRMGMVLIGCLWAII
jgi:hypothetical protein